MKQTRQRKLVFNGSSLVMRRPQIKLGGALKLVSDCIPRPAQLAIPSADQQLREKQLERVRISQDLLKMLGDK